MLLHLTIIQLLILYFSFDILSSSENENYEGKDPMSPEKITSHY